MHLVEADADRHGLALDFPRLLGESLFATNAFTFHNGVSPYMGLYGRQPAMLPDLENLDFPDVGTSSDGRREARVRQSAIGRHYSIYGDGKGQPRIESEDHNRRRFII